MKKTLLLTCSLFLTGISFSQTTDLGGPISWKQNIELKSIVPSVQMKSFDLTVVQAEDVINDAAKSSPWRFGYKYDTDFNLDNAGNWENLPNGGRIWRMEIKAPGAITMNFLLKDLTIPDGAQLYFHDAANTNRVGAYTSRNNREDGLLGTELVFGDDVIVEYYEPSTVVGQGFFTIENVIHGYRTLDAVQDNLLKALNSSGACNIDVNCPLGDIWWNQIRSVAMIVVNGNGACTGALINNTCDDGTPYFLTANHCLGGGTGNWAFRFNWQSPEGTESCATSPNSSTSTFDETANGATVLVSGSQADHALLQIDNMTEADAVTYGAFYAGWNSNDAEAGVTSAIGIHHPSGDVKKICAENDAPYHQTAGGASVWYIDEWEEGVTEPGSSGSPLFDQEGRIIGQLYGGAAACSGTNNNGAYDFYGRLGVSWGLGIDGYLNPTSCGPATTSNYGYDPNPATAGIAPILTLDFAISPNPSNGLFTVSLVNGEAITGTVTVTDMTGRVVYSKEAQKMVTETVDISNVQNGSYILQVVSAGRIMNKTIVVNH